MPNGGFDPEAKYAQLGERVDNQSRQIAQVDSRMTQGFSEIASQIRGLVDDIRGGSKTQWPVLISLCAVSVSILGGLGYLALQPIKDNITQIREDAKGQASGTSSALSTIVDKMVTQKEMEWRTARSAEDRARMEGSLKEVRDAQVPREELTRIWANYDQRFQDQQRQVDELKQAQGSVYGARDVIMDLRQRLDRVERERIASSPGS
ncbi:hypothetical protein IFT66_10275 [Rhizobium sp. CFBP 13726]|uniref:hypothetical protein n=1 Tax=Rhizobium sp. CFBP 13726 TaxID=2775296 RepID=UPI00177FD92F|nr:hypothetical protein [Rhizobium sp. CFBP 13726]MBD8651463.1 hypothetical protein [Rhizobium sp. CFBP 13726]